MSETPAQGARPALNRDRILRAALAVIDRDGLDAFSMRRLGTELGVDPMAVYRHLPNKGAVLDGIVELIWSRGIDLDATERAPDWRVAIAVAMRSVRAELLRHPNAVALLATHPLASTEEQYLFLERLLERLEFDGLPAGADLLALLNVLAMYTLGHLTAEVEEPAGRAGGEFEPAQLADLAAVYPRLVSLFGSPMGANYDPDWQYERGLAAILTGWGSSL